MPRKAKIIHQGRIRVLEQGGEPADLTPDEQMTVNSLQREQDRKDVAKVSSKLTHKGRPLPDHIRRAIEEADRKAAKEEP